MPFISNQDLKLINIHIDELNKLIADRIQDLIKTFTQNAIKSISAKAKEYAEVDISKAIDSISIEEERLSRHTYFALGAGSKEAFNYNFIKSELLFVELITIVSKQEQLEENINAFYSWFIQKLKENEKD